MMNKMVSSFSNRILEQTPPRIRDLLDLVMAAQQVVGIPGEGWRRRVRLRVPVVCKDFWLRDEIMHDLHALLESFFGDRFAPGLAPMAEPVAQPVIEPFIAPEEHAILHGAPGLVAALWSSFDAFAGILSYLKTQPSLRAVATIARATDTGWHPELARLAARGNAILVSGRIVDSTGSLAGDGSQLLHVVWAAAVAVALGSRQVVYFENGVENLQLPITARALAGLPGPTLRPETAILLQRLIATAIEDEFQIVNPFIAMTPVEVGQSVLATGGVEALKTVHELLGDQPTVTGELHATRLDRALATLGALWSTQPLHDHPGDDSLESLVVPVNDNVAEVYVDTMRKLTTPFDAELSAHLRDSAEQSAIPVTALARKHIDAVRGVLASLVQRHAMEIVDGLLPINSLLARAVTPQNSQLADGEASAPIFRKKGGCWEISYESETPIYLNHVDGLAYIHIMLQNPGRIYAAVELRQLVTGRPIELGFSDGDLSDRQALTTYMRTMSDLESEYELARENNDLGRMARLRHELDSLEQEISRSSGLGGRPRNVGDSERARRSVSNAITRAIKQVQSKNPVLARHLKSTIRMGSQLCYTPREPITWIT